MQAPLSSNASRKFLSSISLAASPPTSELNRPASARVEASRSFGTHPLSEGAGLAHDAGNLLGALGLYCELLALPGVLQTEHRHYAEELRLLSGRSRTLIDRLLHSATNQRPTQHEPLQEKEWTVLPDAIEDCRGLLNAVARRPVSIAYGADAALPVAVSRESLERILANLIKNAVEAMELAHGQNDKKVIQLRASCNYSGSRPERIVLTVEDQGCGMTACTVKNLMGKERSNAFGTRGIGFRVVRELVEASGGQLQLTSQIGVGTTVTITWPVAQESVKNSIGEKTMMPMPNGLTRRRNLIAIARTHSGERLSC